MRKIIIIGALIFFMILLSGTVSAANYIVTPGTNSIQTAVNTASDGDTLNLTAGTYNEYNIKVNKSLIIAGPKTTGTSSPTAVIDAQNQGRVFNITSGLNVTLKYLTIINGNASKDTTNQDGGGIYSNNSSVAVIGCNITNNGGYSGGGIYNYGGTLTVTGSTISNNNASYGGGLLNTVGGTCTVTGSTISNNNASSSGGGIYNYRSNCTVTGSTISNNNAASGNGGGIYNYEGNCTITGCNINNNAASGSGGGIYTKGILTVTASYVKNNAANDGGGILNTVGGTLTVKGSNISGNIATNYGGGIYNYGTCTVTGSTINGNTASSRGGGIYNNGPCTVSGSNINGNTATSYAGGGIYNENSTLKVAGSNINGNTASNYGGGIVNYGTLTVTGSNINGNTATNYYGGGIYNIGTCTVTGSNINGNTANTRGGGIYNNGPLAVNGCNFELNVSPAGNAIFNGGGDTSNRIIHFNRFHNPGTGYEIFCYNSVDARYNWWGSNLNPSSKVYGDVIVSPWIILNINASKGLIGKNINSIITADLAHDSNGIYHNPADVHVPNGIPIQFTTTLGSIASQTSLLNVFASATLTGGTISGTADVFAFLDDAIAQKSVTIETTPPTVSANPKGGLYNVNKYVYLKMNEAGTIYYTTNGSIPTTSSRKYTAPILISSTTTLRFFAVDTAGNPSNICTEKYTIDKIVPKVISTTPKNSATGVSRTSTIVIKFSENIKASTYWSKIYVKNLKTGKLVSISKNISGNILYIKTTTTRTAYTLYQVYIPGKAVKDYAGNNLATIYTFRFKTGRY